MSPSWLLLLLLAGVIDYWDASTYTFPKDTVKFKFKLDTDMYALAKAKTTAPCIEVLPLPPLLLLLRWFREASKAADDAVSEPLGPRSGRCSVSLHLSAHLH